jgi:AcrR family transcriptional regulator
MQRMTTAKPLRSDGEQARQRLLLAALECFATHGYSKASVRDIAECAQANVAAIRYYFGDKAGLYRAVFTDPAFNPPLASAQQPPADLRSAIQAVVQGLLAPLKAGDAARWFVRLYFREMVEPSDVWQGEVPCQSQMQAVHALLLPLLAQHLGMAESAAQADDDVHALVFELLSLGSSLYLGEGLLNAIRPQLLQDLPALERYQQRLEGYAFALVNAEAQRRGLSVPPLGP